MRNQLRLDEAVEFAENPEPRCPCVLLLDTSGSMQGAPIDALNEGLRALQTDLLQNTLAARRVEVAIVVFDSDVRVVQDFVTPDELELPVLTAQGLTCMGTGIQRALDMVQSRKATYRAHGIAYYRPWIFLITDGESQGESEQLIEQVRQRIETDEAEKRVAFFSVGVENANLERLKYISVRTPLRLKGLRFTEMFLWLSASITAVSHSQLDEQVALPPVGWGAT